VNPTTLEANIAQSVVQRRHGYGAPLAAGEPSPPGSIRVVVVESSYLIREFLADALSSATQVDLVAVCCDGTELESRIATWCPDVVLADIRMPTSDEEGIRIADRLRETDPRAGVVVLGEDPEPACAIALLAGGSGRRGYLLKQRIRNRRELIRAIETVARGDCVIDPMIVDEFIETQGREVQSRLSRLTARERELLAAVATGKSNAAIADSLFLTTGAVSKQVDSIFAKLALTDGQDVGARARTVLLFLAGEQGDAQPR
jgi:DNA-binding NarL/FixJ family response regulator